MPDRYPLRDFTTLTSAVKKSKRTVQYKVLSALWSLDADTGPVTVTRINKLLALHLGKDVPRNVTASLKSYTGLVRAEHGSPRRWSLTEKGLARLRKLSGLELAAESPDETFLYDVGIICALEDPEFAAVVRAFGGPSRWSSVGSARFPHVYRSCELNTVAGRKLKVVGTTATSMGLTAASIVTTQLIMQFRPRIVVMVGIAAGTRDGHKQYGDVLVADPSVDYNSGKVVFADGIRDFLPDPYPIGLNPRLRSVLQRYRGAANPVFEAIRWGLERRATWGCEPDLPRSSRGSRSGHR